MMKRKMKTFHKLLSFGPRTRAQQQSGKSSTQEKPLESIRGEKESHEASQEENRKKNQEKEEGKVRLEEEWEVDEWQYLSQAFALSVDVVEHLDLARESLESDEISAFLKVEDVKKARSKVESAFKEVNRLVRNLVELYPALEHIETKLVAREPVPEMDEEDLMSPKTVATPLQTEQVRPEDVHARLRGEMDLVKLMHKLEKMQRENVAERCQNKELDSFCNKMHHCKLSVSAWERALGCMEKFSHWKPFSEEAEGCWERKQRASHLLADLEKTVTMLRTTWKEEVVVQLGQERASLVSKAHAALAEFITYYRQNVKTLHSDKESFAFVSKQAFSRAKQCEKAFTKLAASAPEEARIAHGNVRRLQIRNLKQENQQEDALGYEIETFEELRSRCTSVLDSERRWRDRHDPEETQRETDTALNVLRQNAHKMFMAHPNSLENYENLLVRAFCAIKQEKAVREGTSDIRGDMPILAVLECLHTMSDFYKQVYQEAQRLEEAVANAKGELQKLKHICSSDVAEEKLEQFEEHILRFEALQRGNSGLQGLLRTHTLPSDEASSRREQQFDFEDRLAGGRESIADARAHLFQYFWSYMPEVIAIQSCVFAEVNLRALPPLHTLTNLAQEKMHTRFREAFLRSLLVVEGLDTVSVGPLQKQYQVVDKLAAGTEVVIQRSSAKPRWSPNMPQEEEEEEEEELPQQQAQSKQEKSDHHVASEKYLVLRLPFRDCVHGSAFQFIPAGPHISRVEQLLVCKDEMVAIMPYFSQGSLADWCELFPPSARKLEEVRSIVMDILSGLVILEEESLAHGFVAMQNIFIAGSGRASLGMSSPGHVAAKASDLEQLGKLVKSLTDDMLMEPAQRKVLDSLLSIMMKAGKKGTSANQIMQHPFFDVPIQDVEMCPICTEKFKLQDGIKCTDGPEGHFICKDCLEGYLCNISDLDAGGALFATEGAIHCFDPSCTAQPLPVAAVARLVSPESFALYNESVKRLIQAKTMEQMETEFKEREKSIIAQSMEQALIKRHVSTILNDIFTLKCPNGHAFVDFDGCMALTCSTCQACFCGYCLADCQRDAHPHVRACSGGHDLFISQEKFKSFQNERRLRLFKTYWQDSVLTNFKDSPSAAMEVAKQVKPAMKQLGIKTKLEMKLVK